MAIYVVVSGADDGPGSLREALRKAEATAEADEIRFDAALTPAGQFGSSISLLSPLVIESGSVFINGDADGDGVSDATISGVRFRSSGFSLEPAGVRLFEVRHGAELLLDSVDLADGQDFVSPDENRMAVAGLFNEGRTTLRNVYFGLIEARVLDRPAGTGGSPDAALIYNAPGAEMLLEGVAIGSSFAIVGSDGATTEETTSPGGTAVAGVLNEGRLAANLLALSVAAQGGSTTSPDRAGGDAVIGILNRGVLIGVPAGDDFDRVIGVRDALAEPGDVTEAGSGRSLIGAFGGNGEAVSPAFTLAVLSGAGGALPDNGLFLPPAFGRTNTISGRDENDTLIGFDGPNELFGRGGDDLVIGRGGADTLVGGEGDDTLIGGEGDDLFILHPPLGGPFSRAFTSQALGGQGDDKFLVGGGGFRSIDGGAGMDRIALVGSNRSGLSLDLGVSGPQSAAEGLIVHVEGVEMLVGSDFNDTLSPSDEGEAVFGGFGQDILSGRGGADLMLGEAGDDTLSGMDGVDTLFGGSGSDMLDGGASADWIEAGAGGDTAFGREGRDTIRGGGGSDSVDGGGGRDSIEGGQGPDVLLGGGGADFLRGEGGADEIEGGAGRDRIAGGTGNDTLVGGASGDRLSGGSGDDVLFGEAGRDTLSGGAGRDVFVFALGSGQDQIRDFGPDADLIAFISGARSIRDLVISQSGSDTAIVYEGGRILVEDVLADLFDVSKFIFSE